MPMYEGGGFADLDGDGVVDFDQEQQLRDKLNRLRELRDQKVREQQVKIDEARRYLDDPQGWVRRFIRWEPGEGLTAYQTEVIGKLPTKKRVAVRGPHGLGKTGVAAITVLWFAITREQAGLDWKVLTTASAWRHLTKYLWPEIHKWARRLDWEALGRQPYNERTELLDLTLKQNWGAASAVASSKPELIEGAHADSLLYLIDEAKIVPDAVWDAIEGAFSGGRMTGYPEALALAISTPGPPVGRFYDIHRRAPGLEDWWVRHVKVDEAMAAGRISPEWVEQRRRQWGGDSALFANRVLGEFHASDEDSLIPLAWVEAAIERWTLWDEAGQPDLPLQIPRVVGVDVARSGRDNTVIGHRVGYLITHFDAHNLEDTMRTAARVGPMLSHGGEEDDPRVVGVIDTIGVGAGVFDRLRELKLPVLAYTGSAKTAFKDRTGEYGFVNTRSAAYWHMRELLDPANDSIVMLPPVDLMISDLTTPTWDINSGAPPKIVVEKKEDVVERLGRSPDHGDAVVMMFWAEQLRREGQIAKVHRTMPSTSMGPLAQGARSRVRGASPLSPLG